uniref:Uncharacterized protein n=1 Tax=Geospiza parvula TaxID=87175 RepID=A0A8C3M3S2_GEOPR
MAAVAGAGERAGAELPDACPGADSGNVSQSQSRASGLGEAEDEDASEASLSATAAAYSAYLLADRSLFSEQIESLDKSLEDLLTRVDEFVGMLDMIRSDSSQVVNESIPQIYTKATEMRQIYRKIDKLEVCICCLLDAFCFLTEGKINVCIFVCVCARMWSELRCSPYPCWVQYFRVNKEDYIYEEFLGTVGIPDMF